MGSPRSGTTWVSFLLGHHPEIACIHHSTMFPHLFALEQWRQDGGPHYITGGGAQRLDRDTLDALLAPLAEGVLDAYAPPGTSVIVDKTPENVRLAGAIHRVLPAAHFLHVVRDPRAVVASQRAASRGGFAQREFPTRAADAATSWRRDVQSGMQLAGVADRYLQVRYEDLMSDAEAELGRLFEWLGVTCTPALCAEAVAASDKPAMQVADVLPDGFVRVAAGWQSELSAREVRTIEHVCGDLMRSLGYEPAQPAGATPLAMRWHAASSRAFEHFDRILRIAREAIHRLLVGRNPPWAPVVRPDAGTAAESQIRSK